jgi:hypothetical protein
VVITDPQNTAVGDQALFSNMGSANTATGFQALVSNTTGDLNTAAGVDALRGNTTGDENTAIGAAALFGNTAGVGNTAIGVDALFSNTTGFNNVASGEFTLNNNTTGSSNTALGFNAGNSVTTANNVICIGLSGQNVSNSCFIGQIFGKTSSGGTQVFINSDGRLGTTTSSRRFKEEIRPMGRASDVLFALKPVTFRYKKGIDPQGSPQFGLVAEEVEAVNPDLVVRDKQGKVNTVRYEQVNAMLLNEFLKEHRRVQEQEAMIKQLKEEMENILARLKEHDSRFERVSNQIEEARVGPQVVQIP